MYTWILISITDRHKKASVKRLHSKKIYSDISQDKLPLYLSFFEFAHNVKKALFSSLLPTIVK
jgi:hypothetical protein